MRGLPLSQVRGKEYVIVFDPYFEIIENCKLDHN